MNTQEVINFISKRENRQYSGESCRDLPATEEMLFPGL